MDKTLPAIKLAEDILALMVKADDKQIDEALAAIAKLEGTYGILWGLKNIRTSGLDLDYYMLKGRVLEFIKEAKKDKIWVLAEAVALKREAESHPE